MSEVLSTSSPAGSPTKATASAAEGGVEPIAVGAKASSSSDKDEDEQDDEDDSHLGIPSTGAVVDMDVFGQLLEIDDDDTHEFSKMLAFDYISQAESTFDEIEKDLASGDLDALSRKGHFLKGSSAALGLQRVQHSCEAMQHFGNRLDAKGDPPKVEPAVALNRCRKLLVRLRKEQDEAKAWLTEFYH